MKLLAVNCNVCGAPLSVPHQADYVTCNFCSSQLSVQRTESVAFTEVIGELQETTREIAEELRDLKKKSAIERLDRAWEKQRETLSIRGTDGTIRIPSRGTSVLVGTIQVVVGGVVLFVGIGEKETPIMLMGIALVVFALGFTFFQIGKVEKYEKAERRYWSKRRRLMKELVGRAAGDA